jgi:amino acid adenylation domain-containing protein
MLVGIFMDRSPECLAAMLGVWRIGAAYLGLDPLSPPERLAYVLRDSEASFIVTARKFVSLLPAHTSPVVVVEDFLPWRYSDSEYPQVTLFPGDLAYILYTSGSTGRPKGVEVCHSGLANVVTAIADELQLQPEEVLLAHTSLSFDVSNLELYLPLISGGSLYIAEGGRIGDGPRLSAALKESRATTMLGSCTLWQVLLETGWEGKPDLRAISGGEVLPLALAKELLSRTAALWNHYGPTEATICSTTARIDSTTEKISIGRPLANVTVHVLDSHLQPVATGTTGELYIGGHGVARGYHNRQDLTAASFLSDLFSSESGARLYKTGDLVRTLPDGSLEFCGRIDNQVKIHGYRIELEEIEEQLRTFPQMGAVAVAAVDRGDDDRRIVAWFESKETVSPAHIREFLRKRLPSYMIPSEFRQVASMPLNESGKIDRKALSAGCCPIDSKVVPEPATDMESQLRHIWEDLLHVRPIALTDSFFDLGGDSLLATLLVSQIETYFGRKISPDLLIECPDIKSLAARLRSKNDLVSQMLTPLRTKGSKAPLFIVQGIGGNTSVFRSLSAHLGDQQPVYCMPLPSGIVRDRAEMNIKTVAEKYLAAIRRISPRGPYHLAGHSFGGLLAFEIAAQLTHAGEQVGLLALLDADFNLAKSPDGVYRLPHTPTLVLRRYQARLRSLTEKGLGEVVRRRTELIRLRKQVKLAKRAAEGEVSAGPFGAKELLVLAGREYDPAPYAGDTVLFRAQDEVRDDADRDLGWARIVREGLQVVDVPGDHLTVFDEPNVSILASKLTDRLLRGAPQGGIEPAVGNPI